MGIVGIAGSATNQGGAAIDTHIHRGVYTLLGPQRFERIPVVLFYPPGSGLIPNLRLCACIKGVNLSASPTILSQPDAGGRTLVQRLVAGQHREVQVRPSSAIWYKRVCARSMQAPARSRALSKASYARALSKASSAGCSPLHTMHLAYTGDQPQ